MAKTTLFTSFKNWWAKVRAEYMEARRKDAEAKAERLNNKKPGFFTRAAQAIWKEYKETRQHKRDMKAAQLALAANPASSKQPRKKQDGDAVNSKRSGLAWAMWLVGIFGILITAGIIWLLTSNSDSKTASSDAEFAEEHYAAPEAGKMRRLVIDRDMRVELDRRYIYTFHPESAVDFTSLDPVIKGTYRLQRLPNGDHQWSSPPPKVHKWKISSPNGQPVVIEIDSIRKS